MLVPNPNRAFPVGPNPNARGQHRAADLAARPGSRVRSACAGQVVFAGRVPRAGRTVSVRCGPLVATYQQLATVAVRRGQRVLAGATLGTVGRSADRHEGRPHLHLGARVAASGRYVDPLSLLGGTLRAPPLMPAQRIRPPAPPARAPRSRVRVRVRVRDPRGRVRAPLAPRALPLGMSPSLSRPSAPYRATPAPDRTAPPTSPTWHGAPGGPASPAGYPQHGIPWTVWTGACAIAAALQIGGLVRRGRRRRAAAATARTA